MIGAIILLSLLGLFLLEGLVVWIYCIVDDFRYGYSDDAIVSLWGLIVTLIFATGYVLVLLGI